MIAEMYPTPFSSAYPRMLRNGQPFFGAQRRQLGKSCLEGPEQGGSWFSEETISGGSAISGASPSFSAS